MKPFSDPQNFCGINLAQLPFMSNCDHAVRKLLTLPYLIPSLLLIMCWSLMRGHPDDAAVFLAANLIPFGPPWMMIPIPIHALSLAGFACARVIFK